VRRWWLVIALVLSLGMNLGLLIALALSSPAFAQQQQGVMRPAAPGRLQQLADRLGIEGPVRRRFIQRQRQFFAETPGPRARLNEIRREVRAEMTRPEPDRGRIDELLREGSGIFLMLERAVVANVLDSRAMLPPDAERKYVDLISRLQLEGPGQLGRLPPANWPWWWRFRRPQPPGPLTPLDRDRPAPPPKVAPAPSPPPRQ
jgi:hypothetical protein